MFTPEGMYMWPQVDMATASSLYHVSENCMQGQLMGGGVWGEGGAPEHICHPCACRGGLGRAAWGPGPPLGAAQSWGQMCIHSAAVHLLPASAGRLKPSTQSLVGTYLIKCVLAVEGTMTLFKTIALIALTS